jgi:hypothetical protein
MIEKNNMITLVIHTVLLSVKIPYKIHKTEQRQKFHNIREDKSPADLVT